MRECSAVVRLFDVMAGLAETPRGDVFAYRIWNRLRCRPAGTIAVTRAPGKSLGAAASGRQSFIYKDISFTTKQGLLHRLTKRGRWVLVIATLSGYCQLCLRVVLLHVFCFVVCVIRDVSGLVQATVDVGTILIGFLVAFTKDGGGPYPYSCDWFLMISLYNQPYGQHKVHVF